MYLQISMEGYADPTFFCKNHQNSKRIKAKSYHMMLANKVGLQTVLFTIPKKRSPVL